MNILIIDDDPKKRSYITYMITKDNPKHEISECDNFQDAVTFIDTNSQCIDLIVLDWCFPIRQDRNCVNGMGGQVLGHMASNGQTNKVIICSSDVVEIDKDEYPFVLGSILFYPCIQIDEEINKLLNPPVETQDKGPFSKGKKPPQKTGNKRPKAPHYWWQK